MRQLAKQLALPAIAAITIAGCHSLARSTESPTELKHPAWSRSAVIYEVNVRQYTPEGTFAAFERSLPRLDSLGVDILWFMPLQPIGVARRKGSLGSYYSISNYIETNPEFGSKTDFRAVVDDAHRHGMKVILDWVPNHTAFDHVWVAQHPDWYTHRADGSISNAHDNDDKETDWTDVAELNYGNADMRREMIRDMRWWIDSMNVDGFRCDVAGGVPMDFWADARRELTKVRPDLFMLAEAEGPQFHQSFDMTYGWELHHLLNQIAQGKQSPNDLDAYIARQRSSYPASAYRMYFTSNHDENSWNGSEFERMGANHIPAYILAATAEQGMPLLYSGQEASFSKRLKFFDKDTLDWSGPSLATFYRTVFDLKHRNPALGNGQYGGRQARLETDGGDRVYAFTRSRGKNTVLVAVNFGDAGARVHFRGLTEIGDYTDWFSPSVSVNFAGGGQIDIPAHGYRVFVRGASASSNR